MFMLVICKESHVIVPVNEPGKSYVSAGSDTPLSVSAGILMNEPGRTSEALPDPDVPLTKISPSYPDCPPVHEYSIVWERTATELPKKSAKKAVNPRFFVRFIVVGCSFLQLKRRL
jgi:hypothetical protein